MITNSNWGADVRGYRGFADNVVVFAKGQSGEDVRLLQNYLNAIGYSVGAADGIFGLATEGAVMKFQNTLGLPMTGVVDQTTFTAITNTYNTVTSDPVSRPEPTGINLPVASMDPTKKKILIAAAALLGAAGLLYFMSKSSPRRSMAGRKSKRRMGDWIYDPVTKKWRKEDRKPNAKRIKLERYGSSKIWGQDPKSGKWQVERVVEDDPRQQKRWLEILRSDEPDRKFKLSKEKPS